MNRLLHFSVTVSLSVIIVFLSAPPVPLCAGAVPTSQPADAQMDGWWVDLQKPEPWASAALLNFSARPQQAVVFIGTHLKPLKLDQKELDSLLDALGSDDAKVWAPAFEKLGYFDPRLNVNLETLMNSAETTVRRNHLVELLNDEVADNRKGQNITLQPIHVGAGGYDFLDNAGHRMWEVEDKVAGLDNSDKSHKKQWQRADRAIVLLQHIGTPEAVAVLKDLATGHPDARPTKIARAALASLGEKAGN